MTLHTIRQSGAWPLFGVFFLEAFVLGNWIPRIPDVKAQFEFSASQLGRLLDPENDIIQLDTLYKAATAVGKALEVSLV